MQGKRSRLALVGILALALGVTAGLTVSDAAAAKKKKPPKAGGIVDITKAVNAPVPDATATNAHGLLTSTIDVGGKKFKRTQIRDVNATVQTTGNTAGSVGDLQVLLTAPNGATVWLFAFLGGQNVGPLTLDDETFNQLVPFTAPRDPTQVAQPYVGTAQPWCYFASGGCPLSLMDRGPVTGTWTLRIYDVDPSGPATSVLNLWRLNVVAGKPYKTK
jgi:subtilisin-like proprotein convertase family protein